MQNALALRAGIAAQGLNMFSIDLHKIKTKEINERYFTDNQDISVLKKVRKRVTFFIFSHRWSENYLAYVI